MPRASRPARDWAASRLPVARSGEGVSAAAWVASAKTRRKRPLRWPPPTPQSVALSQPLCRRRNGRHFTSLALERRDIPALRNGDDHRISVSLVFVVAAQSRPKFARLCADGGVLAGAIPVRLVEDVECDYIFFNKGGFTVHCRLYAIFEEAIHPRRAREGSAG